ncbi:hypothetical protein EJB05_31284, partial [Eragrostis curvula]
MVRKPSHADAGTGESKERKGLWSPEEDERLFTQITRHGVSTWSSEDSTDNAATAASPLPIPARFPVFTCQLLDGSGSDGGGAAVSTTTTQQNSGSEESEASVGDDAHFAAGHSNMIHNFLEFDELDYPVDLLMDVPGVMDAWESELYSTNSMVSLN